MSILAVPTGTQVIEAWVKSLNLVSSTMVGPTLPPDHTTWASTGFFQVSVVGGDANVDLGTKEPVYEISYWLTSADGHPAPFNTAENAAYNIYNAAQNARSQHLTVGSTTVFLLGISPISMPMRVPDPRTGFARVMVQVRGVWGQ